MKYLFLFFLVISFSFAHLEAGSDKVVGNYLIDFGYSPKNIVERQKVTLAFNLVNDTTKEVIEPESVWVRISNSKEIVFAGTFKPTAKHVAFSYSFPYAENYEITARFNSIVETDFYVNVMSEQNLNSWITPVLIAIILILLAIVMKKR